VPRPPSAPLWWRDRGPAPSGVLAGRGVNGCARVGHGAFRVTPRDACAASPSESWSSSLDGGRGHASCRTSEASPSPSPSPSIGRACVARPPRRATWPGEGEGSREAKGRGCLEFRHIEFQPRVRLAQLQHLPRDPSVSTCRIPSLARGPWCEPPRVRTCTHSPRTPPPPPLPPGAGWVRGKGTSSGEG
jgi:hypothetical protein